MPDRQPARAALCLVHVELADANQFVSEHHRHHQPVRGHRFSIGVHHDGRLRGVAIVGRPVARGYDPRTVVEVLRCATDGIRNGCSFLYGAAARASRALGYQRIHTYTLADESGASLRAAGWVDEGISPDTGRPWRHTAGPRRTDQPNGPKRRWALPLRGDQ